MSWNFFEFISSKVKLLLFSPVHKLRDPHDCLKVMSYSFSLVNKSIGIRTIVLIKDLIIRLLIHLIIGDVVGSNNLCWHWNNHDNICHMYCNWKCSFEYFSLKVTWIMNFLYCNQRWKGNLENCRQRWKD